MIPCTTLNNIQGVGIRCEEIGSQEIIHQSTAVKKDNAIDIQQTCEKILQEPIDIKSDNFRFSQPDMTYSAFFFLDELKEVKYVDCETKVAIAREFPNFLAEQCGNCFNDNQALKKQMQKLMAHYNEDRQKSYHAIKSYLYKLQNNDLE